MASQTNSISITFTYSPPEGIFNPKSSSGEQLLRSGHRAFPLNATTASQNGTTAHSHALLQAVRSAKVAMGGELTAWRDAVGDKEQKKEASLGKTGAGSSDDDEDGME